MKGIRTTLVVAAGAVLFSTGDVFAWGPATHVSIAQSILEQLAFLPAGLAALLGRHAIAYLYGNMAADIVFAKRLSRVKQFCHHWSTGFRLLEEAADDRDKAFAYGYLSHLAADTVAHGKFVPRQIMLSDCSVNFGHFFWELRADNQQSERTWGVVRLVLAGDHQQHHGELSRHMKDTLLSYQTNRVLFEGMNSLAARKEFRSTMELCSRYSRFPLSRELLTGYEAECVDRVLSLLAEGDRSSVLREDPNGTSSLTDLRVRRRANRRLQRRGLPHELRRREASLGWAPAAKNPAASRTRVPVMIDAAR